MPTTRAQIDKVSHDAVSQTIPKAAQGAPDHQSKAKPLNVSLRLHGHPGETGDQQRREEALASRLANRLNATPEL